MGTSTMHQTRLFATPAPARRPQPRYAQGDLSALVEADGASVDCETTDRDPMTAALTHVAFATNRRISGFVRATSDALQTLDALARERRLVMHNALYDLVVLARHGVHLLDRVTDDTRIASHLFDAHASHSLVAVADRWLHHRGLIGFRDLPPLDALSATDSDGIMADKGRVDCEETLESFGAMSVAFEGQPHLRRAYEGIDRPLLPVFASMTLRGVVVDTRALTAARDAAAAHAATTISTLQSIAGVRIDPLSDAAVSDWLYTRLGLLPASVTRGGRGSTARAALAALRHPCADLVLEARSRAATVDAFDRWVNRLPADGILHPSYTGWSRPNAPISCSAPLGRGEDDETPLAIDPKPFVRATDGHVFVGVQLSGLRLRWLAATSADPVLRTALDAGGSLSSTLAQHIAPGRTDVVPVVAAWLDAICSGDGPRTVAARTGWRPKDAAAIGEALRDALPAVARMADHLVDAGCKRGWIQTPLGRRRRYEPRYMGRAAMADFLEIAETDTVKLVLRRLFDRFGPAVCFVSGTTVLLDVPASIAPDVAAEAERIGSAAPAAWPWPVPVRIGTGRTWEEVRSK